MGLEQKIKKAYKNYEQGAKLFAKHIDPKSSNFLAVYAKIKKLKDDLCKFANNFDKNFIGTSAVDLTEEIIDNFYQDIRDDFVGRIADGGDYFIYGSQKSFFSKNDKTLLEVIKEAKKEYPTSIETFNSRYKDLKYKFTNAKNLTEFFESESLTFLRHNWDSKKIKNLDVILINEDLDIFIYTIFEAMADELKTKSRILLAKDSEYFDVIPDIKEVAKQPDALHKIISLFENNAKKVINSKECQKLVPDLVKSFEEKLKAINDIKKKSDKLTPQDLHDFLSPEDLEILVSLVNQDKDTEKHFIAEVSDDVKVFPAGKPLPREVEQAEVDDCYLMSTLISLAKNNPKAIKECFVQSPNNLEKLDEFNNIVIRFFYVDSTSPTLRICPIQIHIDKKTVIAPQHIRGRALWPKLIEKAFAIYRKEGYDRFKTSVKNLNKGLSVSVMLAITGKRVAAGMADGSETKFKSEGVGNYANEKFKPHRIIETLKKILKNGQALTCAFKDKFTTEDAKNNEKIEITTEHSYAIVGFKKNEKNKEYIRLIDPYKVLGRTYSATVNRNRQEPLQEGGHIAIPLEDFKKHFERIDYTGKKDF